jgi:hypothetical protein
MPVNTAVVAITFLAVCWGAATRGAWPAIRILRFQRLQTRRGRRDLGRGLLLALAIGLGAGLLVGQVAGVVSGLVVAVAGLLIFGAIGLLDGMQLAPDEYELAAPADPTRNGALAELIIELLTEVTADAIGGLMCGLLSWLAWSSLVKDPNPDASLQYLLLSWAAITISLERDRWRYLVLLLCTRRWSSRWLPWRLSRFLWWSYDAGLLRVAGTSYQFRHREFQDYLARNPIPSAGKH